MRAELEVLLGNLRALKNEGATDVFVSEEALDALRARVAAAVRENAATGTRVAAAASAASVRPTPLPAPSQKPSPHSSPRVSSPPQQNSRAPEPEPFPPISFDEIVSAKPTPAKSVPAAPEKKAPSFDVSVSKTRVAAVPATGTNAERLAALREQMLGDPICNEHLHKGKHLVFGEGNADASVFFCGEAPGAEEETAGRPFVGPAGKLLDKMIAAAGLAREQVYIGNIMKWRPELPTLYGNRPPTPEEMEYCLPYLAAQTEIIRPRVIVALGLTAVNGLLGFDPDRRIGAMRGKTLDFRGIPVVATYHPSYLLRNDSVKSKRAAWEDFLRMMEIAELPISERQRNFFLPKK
ncbi:MAG: uracil-DNA glycosylase [Opitutales bacterium]|nr:uracil-DNA glycosylase [Opitutales bacterium]